MHPARNQTPLATLAALGGSILSFDSVSFMVTFTHGQLHVRPLSGRMTRSEVATILRTNKDGVSHLVKRKLLKPLGSQKKRKQLFFSSLWLFDQMSDMKWLSKITDELCLFSENKNGREDETAENSIGSQT
jgi:hypothetical protein